MSPSTIALPCFVNAAPSAHVRSAFLFSPQMKPRPSCSQAGIHMNDYILAECIKKKIISGFFIFTSLIFSSITLTGLPLVCVSGVGPSPWVSFRCLRRVPHQVQSPAGTPGPSRTSYRWTPPAHPPLSCGSPPSPVCSAGREKAIIYVTVADFFFLFLSLNA